MIGPKRSSEYKALFDWAYTPADVFTAVKHESDGFHEPGEPFHLKHEVGKVHRSILGLTSRLSGTFAIFQVLLYVLCFLQCKTIYKAKQKNMFVSSRLMIWNRVGRSDFNFFFIYFFLKKYNAVKCKIECYIYDFK